MKKLPTGIQSFERIVEQDCLYIDKTAQMYNLVTGGEYYFLSRPRRFGKSLFLSTLRCLFEGKRGLFKGLAIENKWEWKKHPVIVIDFNQIMMDTPEHLEQDIRKILASIGSNLGIKIEESLSLKQSFRELILLATRKYKEDVVILIDEYDKPIIDHIGKGKERLKIAEANRDILKSFYGVIKGADAANVLRFVLLTGVSKFSQVSIFSELNNLSDITMDTRYCSMLGVTEEEMEIYFKEHIKSLAVSQSVSPEEVREQLRQRYNGYRFSEEDLKVYNPFSVLRCLDEGKFKNYWFETGTPSFLINLIKENDYYMPDINKLELTAESFSTYDIENLQVEPLLFQTGYITIKDIDPPLYTLGYPNQEVRQSFTAMLFESASKLGGQGRTAGIKAAAALKDGRIEEFIKIMKGIYSEIVYPLHPQARNLKENYYHTIFYLILSMSGLDTGLEVLTTRGRIDLTVEFKDRVYVMEFKCGQSAKAALDQIKEKKYADRFLHTGRNICLLGINFSPDEKNIDDWQVKQL